MRCFCILYIVSIPPKNIRLSPRPNPKPNPNPNTSPSPSLSPNLLSQQMAESGRICIQIHPKPAFLPSTLVLKRSFPIGFLVSIMYLELSVSHTVHYFPALKSEHIWNKLPLASHVHSSVLHDHELVKAGLSTVISLSAWFSLF